MPIYIKSLKLSPFWRSFLKPFAWLDSLFGYDNMGYLLASNDPNTQKIAALNDMCRAEIGISSKVVQTPGIAALSAVKLEAIYLQIKNFDGFQYSNDPRATQDFGAFKYEGERIFWKIDCYSQDLKQESKDPADPEKTLRVLTIMLAKEFKKYDTAQKRKSLLGKV